MRPSGIHSGKQIILAEQSKAKNDEANSLGSPWTLASESQITLDEAAFSYQIMLP